MLWPVDGATIRINPKWQGGNEVPRYAQANLLQTPDKAVPLDDDHDWDDDATAGVAERVPAPAASPNSPTTNPKTGAYGTRSRQPFNGNYRLPWEGSKH